MFLIKGFKKCVYVVFFILKSFVVFCHVFVVVKT